MSDHPLLADIEAFCRTHGMSEASFGVKALKDWKFVRDLRGEKRDRPRRIWPETEREVRRFMATYRPDTPQESARAA
jgi:hypothetical protein